MILSKPVFPAWLVVTPPTSQPMCVTTTRRGRRWVFQPREHRGYRVSETRGAQDSHRGLELSDMQRSGEDPGPAVSAQRGGQPHGDGIAAGQWWGDGCPGLLEATAHRLLLGRQALGPAPRPRGPLKSPRGAPLGRAPGLKAFLGEWREVVRGRWVPTPQTGCALPSVAAACTLPLPRRDVPCGHSLTPRSLSDACPWCPGATWTVQSRRGVSAALHLVITVAADVHHYGSIPIRGPQTPQIRASFSSLQRTGW